MNIRTAISEFVVAEQYLWSAWDSDSYDLGSPMGMGPTKQAAIDDLIEQVTERSSEKATQYS
jgi:hypothetical protein